MTNNPFAACNSTLIQIACPQGQREITLGNQPILDNARVIAIFVSNQVVGRDNQTLNNSGFYLELYAQNTRIQQLPANQFLNFDSNNAILLYRKGIEWQRSQVIFPTNLPASVTVELIVFYDYEN